MLRIFATICLVIVCGVVHAQDSIPAPPCEQVDIPEGKKRVIMKNFIEACEKQGAFINNKGIVEIVEFTNADHLLTWQLSCDIDDGYKSNPPTRFADFNGDIVLIYSANSVGREMQNPDPETYNKCLEEVIGDRVYLRPTIKTRWTNRLMWTDDKPMKRGRSRHVFDSGVEWKVVFNKDGTYKVTYH